MLLIKKYVSIELLVTDKLVLTLIFKILIMHEACSKCKLYEMDEMLRLSKILQIIMENNNYDC